jgi:hypothetical protein
MVAAIGAGAMHPKPPSMRPPSEPGDLLERCRFEQDRLDPGGLRDNGE